MIVIITNKKYLLNTHGRKEITTNLNLIDNTVEDILKECIPHIINNFNNCNKLFNIYLGNQDILYRTKSIRDDITINVVDNIAYEIVEFKTSYDFGEDIQYVKRGKDFINKGSSEQDSKSISKLNQYLEQQDKGAKDRELGEWLFTTGHGFRITLPLDSHFIIENLSPLNSFVIYTNDIIKKPLLGGVFSGDRLSVYTTDSFYEFESKDYYSIKRISTKPNTLGTIPIIEYRLNPHMVGAFEPVLPLLNAINELTSNRVEGVAQFIQHFMKFINVDIDVDQYEEFKKRGVISVGSTSGRKAEIDLITNELDQSQTQMLANHLYERVLTIVGIPDRKMNNGGNTGTSIEIGQGWVGAENRAKSVESMFRKGEKGMLDIILKILKTQEPKEFSGLDSSDILIKFARNKTANLLVKTQGMLNELQAGIHPRIAISNIGLFSDPENVYQESLKGGYLDKWLFDTAEIPNHELKSPAGTSVEIRGLQSKDLGLQNQVDKRKYGNTNNLKDNKVINRVEAV